ncbi:MAG: hypothetical protein R3C12_18520 [Planctomycetaceae bacterium]|nr:hypothetical protein [Planctomycetaceae bacterium]
MNSVFSLRQSVCRVTARLAREAWSKGTVCALLILLLGCLASSSEVWAEEYQFGFEEGDKSCRVQYDPQRALLKLHERTNGLAFAGQSAERFQFVTSDYDIPVVIECPIPPARILDELRLTLAVFSNRPGVQLSARVVFPRQLDPETGKPLTRLINGDVLQKENSWQRLTCSTSDDVLAKHLILWRGSLKPTELDPRGMYIDRVILRQTLGRGMTEILLDDLRMAPIVEPEQEGLSQLDQFESSRQSPRIDFQLDHLQVNGRSVFPIIVPYQKEPVELFSQLGANVVWVDNFRNRALIDELNELGLWATAWPPSATSSQGEILDAHKANLLPFGPETDGILFWNLGVRIEPETHKQLQHWVHQIKSSDRKFNRPILADVTGAETVFSRDVEMLGVSKHVLQSPYGLRDYAQHLLNRKQLAQPGTFVMTWIQTEPSRAVHLSRQSTQQTPAVIEPEQIRLQTYTALGAGCKGLGFWNWTPLNAEGVGFEERRLVLEQLFQELALLEPFLANGEVIHRFEVTLESHQAERARSASVPPEGAKSATSAEQAKAAGADVAKTPELPPLSAAAAVVRSEHGLVILLSALEEHAQYTPGPMGQSDLRLMIRGLPESAFLWEITSTGLWPLETRRVTGGTEIRLPRFNMTAALMVATDQGVAQEMERKIQRIQQRSADLSLRLAEAKFERVRAVDRELFDVGVGLTEASHVLDQSRRVLEVAREAWTKQQYHQARINADLACQLLRILQRLYWQQAVRHVSSPTSIPHTLCFQTLPDYWRLIQQLSQAETVNPSVIRSGQFEDPDAMLVEGWTKDVSPSKDIVVYDALDPNTAHEGNFCLRMASVPVNPKVPLAPQEPAVSYRSPPISVKPGDLLHVTGWIRIPRPLGGSLEGFRIYDSQYGVASCLKWDQPCSWQQFELLRPIWKQEQLHLFLELHGLGDVAVDDLQVKILRLKQTGGSLQAEASASEQTDETPKSRGAALDFLNRFLK